VEALAEEGHRTAGSVMTAIKTLSFQLSGAQLGITITSLLLGFVIEPTVGAAIEPLVGRLSFVAEEATLATSTVIALLITTSTQMVVSELVPQNWAIARPLQVSLAVATPLRLFNLLFRPLIYVLNSAANWTVRRMGIEPRDELEAVHSLEELEVMIHMSRKEGALPEADFSLLARSISFAEKTAADALLPRVDIVTVTPDQTVTEMAAVALESGHSRFPVQSESIDDIVGIAHVKDTYGIPPADRSKTLISAVMQDALVVPESRKLDTLLVEMRRERKPMAVVVDEYGGTAGIITLEDLLEEIVGDIEDEFDPKEARLTSPSPGIHVLSGKLHRDEVEEACALQIPDGDYDTLAGFLLSLFDRIPEQGEHVSWEGWEFKITSMDRNRIAQVLVCAPGQSLEEEQQ
jgi:CBS domain containing-hemolysin-like protein